MKTRNPLSQQTLEQKKHQYDIDSANNVLAYKSDNTTIPLRCIKPENVEFIAGLWRVQDVFNYTITQIRDKEMVLGQRIEHNEKTFFEYYKAASVNYNCYGLLPLNFDMVVAKYTTDKGEYLAYGRTISSARAFLGIRLYDEYMDLIHKEACKNVMQKVRK